MIVREITREAAGSAYLAAFSASFRFRPVAEKFPFDVLKFDPPNFSGRKNPSTCLRLSQANGIRFKSDRLANIARSPFVEHGCSRCNWNNVSGMAVFMFCGWQVRALVKSDEIADCKRYPCRSRRDDKSTNRTNSIRSRLLRGEIHLPT
jgi:hypothetical protein